MFAASLAASEVLAALAALPTSLTGSAFRAFTPALGPAATLSAMLAGADLHVGVCELRSPATEDWDQRSDRRDTGRPPDQCAAARCADY